MAIKSSSRFLLYMGYGLLLTFALLYIRFPTAEFKAYCEQQIENTFKVNKCDIEKVSYAFPISIVFAQINLMNATDNIKTKLVIEQLSIRPTIHFWRSFKIFGKAYSGSLKSVFKLNWTENSYKFTDTTATNLNVGELLKDQAITNRKIVGTLDGSGTYQGSWSNPEEKTVKAQFALTSGSFELLQPVLSLSLVEFDKINFDITLTEQFAVQQGKLKGKNINASFEGIVNPMKTFQESRLQITGLLEPKREFLQTHPVEAKMVKQYAKRFRKNALPFKIGGTTVNPTFRFSR